MSTAKDIAEQLITRAKNMRTFPIDRPVPDGFEFNGPVPFMVAIKNGMITCWVPAMTEQEAEQQADAWLHERSQGDYE
jgi:hypothetical protein